MFGKKNVVLEQCKGVHCVDLGESFPTHIYLQNLASIQPRTSPVKFAGGGGAESPSAGLLERLRDHGGELLVEHRLEPRGRLCVDRAQKKEPRPGRN